MEALKPQKPFEIHTSTLFDSKKKQFVKDVSLTVDPTTGAITDVIKRTAPLDNIPSGDIDLRDKFVLPGLVDAHTHIFLHSYSEHSANPQIRDESVVERVVRATSHLRAALLSGYTTYRDLGSEGMGAHDVSLRDCVARGLVPGPRLFVATDPLSGTGGYALRTENAAGGVRVPTLSDECDGVPAIRAAVRRRVAAGADVVKFYADYRRTTMRCPPPHEGEPARAVRFPPAAPDPSVPLLAQDEMDEIVAEAKLAGLPAAAHARTSAAALMAAKAGVASVEHLPDASDAALHEMRRRGCVFVPTLAVFKRTLPAEDMPAVLKNTKRAYDAGVRLAAGGDTGVFPHGEGALEVELLREAGVPLEDALEAATVGGWEACGGDRCGYRFGWLEKGTRADVVALEADPRQDGDALRKVSFVMKDGEVWKRDGRPVGMMSQLMQEAAYSGPMDDSWVMV